MYSFVPFLVRLAIDRVALLRRNTRQSDRSYSPDRSSLLITFLLTTPSDCPPRRLAALDQLTI